MGGCQEFLGLSAADVEYNYAMGRVCSNSGHDIVNGKHTGEYLSGTLSLRHRPILVYGIP